MPNVNYNTDEYGNDAHPDDIPKETISDEIAPTNTLSNQSIVDSVIEGSKLSLGTGDTSLNFDPESGLWAGAAEFSNAPFSVDMAGNLTATSGTFSGDVKWSKVQDDDGNKPTDNADVTENNTAQDIVNLPDTPSGSGLYADSSHLGFYDGSNWKAYIEDNGDFYFEGDDQNKIYWTGSTLQVVGDVKSSDDDSRIEIDNSNDALELYQNGDIRARLSSSSVLAFYNTSGVYSGAIAGVGTNQIEINTGNNEVALNESEFYPLDNQNLGEESGGLLNAWNNIYADGSLYDGDLDNATISDIIDVANSGGGDDLGDHTATQDLNMSGYNVDDIGQLEGDSGSNIIDMNNSGEIITNQPFKSTSTSDLGDSSDRWGVLYTQDVGTASTYTDNVYASYIEGGSLSITGDKNFDIKNPLKDNEDERLRYTSMEGPEVALFYRGTEEIKDGELFIEFPDHYAYIVTQNRSVNLTPHSNTNIWVDEITEEGVKVKSEDDTEFSYIVMGERRGYEDRPVEYNRNS